MRIVIDGNDGTGKSTIVERLRAAGYSVSDRGVPTKMIDDDTVEPVDGEFYIILDCTPQMCSDRLIRSGKSLDEKYHTIKDLYYYRDKFLLVASKLGPTRCVVVNSSDSHDRVYANVLSYVKAASIERSLAKPKFREAITAAVKNIIPDAEIQPYTYLTIVIRREKMQDYCALGTTNEREAANKLIRDIGDIIHRIAKMSEETGEEA